jgi:hypothetical protein
LSEAQLEVLCQINEHGTCTWVSTDKVVTEFDPFFICAYGYQDQSDQNGAKHFVWLTLAGATASLTRSFTDAKDAMELLNRIRQVKKRH